MATLPTCRPVQCASCIFRTDGKAVELRPGRLDEIRAYLIRGVTHHCHSARGPRGGQAPVACRGGRDYQLTIWARLGLIPEPTDAALLEAMTECEESTPCRSTGPDLT